jgi:hypothetical protein
MKTPFKNPINNFAPVFLMLIGMLLLGFGCNTSKPTLDPLAGWKIMHGKNAEDLDKILAGDYQSYIQNLQPNEKNYVGSTFFFEDETGRHAVTFEVDKYGKDVWNYYLFYDKDNKRIKVIKSYRGRYWNP